MPVNPKFLAARAAERRHRDLAHLRALCWLPLQRHGVTFARTPLVPFTRRHRIELELARNAFFGPQPVLLGDVFLFLWRLHPLYTPPRPGREQLVANLAAKRFPLLRQWCALGSLGRACLHRRLTRFVRRSDLAAASAAIRRYLDIAYQDAPGEACSPTGQRARRSAISPPRHSADNHTAWLMRTYGLSHEEALDFPIALEHQLARELELQQPDGELNVSDPSDLLLADS